MIVHVNRFDKSVEVTRRVLEVLQTEELRLCNWKKGEKALSQKEGVEA